MPKISIIMPTYNRGHIIAKSIDSVLSQSEEDFELLIIDDGSTDDTRERVGSFKDNRIQYIRYEHNQGANHARNIGIKKAGGDYLAFLDSDNVWHKNYIKKRIQILERTSEDVGGVFGTQKMIGKGHRTEIFPNMISEEQINRGRGNRFLIKQMLFYNVMDTNTVILKKACVQSVDGFDEHLHRLQDWEYFFRILYFSKYKILFDSQPLVKHFHYSDSISNKKNDDAYWQSRLYFLKQYRKVYEEYGCLEKAIALLMDSYEPDITQKWMNCLVEQYSNTVLGKALLIYHQEIQKRERASVRKWDKFLSIYKKKSLLLQCNEQWMELKNDDINIGDYLLKDGYRRVAIYGYGELGKNLAKELSKLDGRVTIVCVIDKNESLFTDGSWEVYLPSDEINDVDVIIVTAIYEFEKIRKRYKDITCVSLYETIANIRNNRV